MTDQQTNPEETPVVEGEVVSATSEQDARIAQLEQEVAQYKDQFLRAKADFQNYKRRTEQERAELIRSASAGLLLKLLPVVDDIDRAIGSVTAEIADSQWYGGFKLIPQKLRTLLESEGVAAIESVGQEFDPNKHEAVIYDESGEGETTVVVAELQKGYTLRDKVLRPAMVKVGKA
ncbi:nucleotide exchange factor GrpE [Chloroflexia bacterium SDU3-3]|nr:nucleotide exchange factor GrpE [Chloroflexia bacterium SDU3-3]